MHCKRTLFQSCLMLLSLWSFPSLAQEALKQSMTLKTSLPSPHGFIRQADSIIAHDTIPLQDSSVFKKYFRWRRDASSRSTYAGASASSGVNDLRAYMSGTPQYCTGSSSNIWESVGPNPTPSNAQEIGLVNAVAANPSNHNELLLGTYESGIWRSTDGGANWQNVTDPLNIISLGISCIQGDPSNSNKYFAGTITHSFDRPYGGWNGLNGVGIIYSTDGGASWIESTYTPSSSQSPSDIGHIAQIDVSPTNSNHITAVGNTTIYQSTDGGVTFTDVYTKSPDYVNQGNGNAIYGTFFTDIAYHATNANLIVATCKMAQASAAPNGTNVDWVYYSNDGGSTWNTSLLPNTRTVLSDGSYWHPGVVFVDATGADPSKLFLAFKLINDKGSEPVYVYTTTNGSSFIQNHYSNTTSLNQNANDQNGLSASRNGFEVSEVNASKFYISGNTLFSNAGTQWNKLSEYNPNIGAPGTSTHADIRDIKILGITSGLDILLIANDGGIAQSNTSGTTWSNLNGSGLTITQFFGFDCNERSDELIGGAIHNGTFNISGSSWDGMVRFGDGDYSLYGYHVGDQTIEIQSIWAGKFYQLWWASETQSGLATTPGYSHDIPLGRRFTLHPTKRFEDSQGRKSLAVLAWDYHLWEISVGPSQVTSKTKLFDYHTQIPSGVPYYPVSMAKLAESNPEVGYLALEGTTDGNAQKRKVLWKTTDGGTSWTNINANFTLDNGASYVSRRAWISDILIHPGNENIVFVTMTAYHKDANGYGKERVLVTTDGGATWSDFSNNLLGVPANSLALAGNILYVGTDAGVYYTDISNISPGQESWICYNRELPNAMVEQVRVNTCSNELYASLRGRGIWKTDLIESDPYSQEITTNQTWDKTHTIRGNVYVRSGATLTITGEVYMGKESRIIVDQGATLNVVGGYIGAHCSEYWGGIYVSGNNTLAPTLANQGRILMSNGATIEDARDAITNIGVHPNGDWIFGTQGGIIEVRDSYFINNRRDIQLLRHNYLATHPKTPYPASIEDCEFIKNNDFSIEEVNASISMWEVYGVEITGCAFKNENTSLIKRQGEALYAINALFFFGDNSNGTCSVEGFAEGIRSINYCLPQTEDAGVIDINSSLFENNTHAIYISGAPRIRVIENEIEVPNLVVSTPQTPRQPIPYGIYLDGCPSFKVRQNTLHTEVANGTVNSVGIVIKDSGPYANRLYKNELDGFTVATEAIGTNRDGTPTGNGAGLVYKCNTFGTSSHSSGSTAFGNGDDLLIPLIPNPNHNSGISERQTSEPQDRNTWPHNLFYNHQMLQIGNFSGNPLTYISASNYPLSNPTNNNLGAGDVRLFASQYNWEGFCEDLPEPESFSVPTLLSEITTLENDLTSELNLKDQLVNGGNTPLIESQILFADEQEEYQQLYVELLSYSPYVETEVLMGIIELDDFPELALRNLLVANPHAAREPEVWDMLVHRVPLLSQQTLNDIEQGTQTLTAFDELLGSIEGLELSLATKRYQLIGAYLSNEETYETTLENFLGAQNTPDFHYLLVEKHISEGEYTAAQDAFDNIPSVCTLSSEALEVHNDLGIIYDLSMLYHESVGESIDHLTVSEINSLTTIAEKEFGVAASKAQALLDLNAVNSTYVEPLYFNTGGSKKAHTDPYASMRSDQAEDQVMIYPNPTSGSLSLTWSALSTLESTELSIEIYTLDGRKVFEVNGIKSNLNFYHIDDLTLTTGAYLLQLKSADQVVHSQNVVVQ